MEIKDNSELSETLIPNSFIDSDFQNESKLKYVHEQAIEAAGSLGKYQIIATLLICLVWIIVPSMPLMIPYYRILPKSICQNKDQTNTYECSLEEFCSGKKYLTRCFNKELGNRLQYKLYP